MGLRSEIVNESEIVRTDHDFRVTDRLGRAIGYRIYLYEYDIVLENDPAQSWDTERVPGHYFLLQGCATRNVHRHQASTIKSFTTAAERDAAVVKLVEGARKRALAPAARLKA